jgi:predicted metalloprotease with PDZ domain
MMSTRFFNIASGRLGFGLGAIALGCAAFVNASAQQISASIRVLPNSSRVTIEGSCAATTKWSFLDVYGGILGLGRRIEQFTIFDSDGQLIQVRQLAPGQFESAKRATRFRYEVNLTPPIMASDSAMVSWVTKERGVLMSGDLLPLTTSPGLANSVTLRIKLPESWQIVSAESENTRGEFNVRETRQGVFALGARLRTMQVNESGMMFRMVTDGDWAFTDREALELAGKILKAHREVFGGIPAKQGMLVLFPFPQSARASEWAAETKAATVTLLMGKLPSKVGALAQLSTPLTHELFHLWVPNGLSLDGDYDWFYEGFTVYQSARTAVQLDLLTFQEFLNSIARASDASTQSDGLSFLDASQRRFTVGRNSVYAKSQIVAFIYDLQLRNASRRKRSLGDVYRRLFQTYASERNGANKTDGNDAVTRSLTAELNSADFVNRDIRSAASINLAAELAQFGLKVEMIGLRTHISVSENLTKQQRDLLRDLGYNDATHAVRRK